MPITIGRIRGTNRQRPTGLGFRDWVSRIVRPFTPRSLYVTAVTSA